MPRTLPCRSRASARAGPTSPGPAPSLSHPPRSVVAMNTTCPCGCGRRLPLSDHQILDVAVHGRWKNELDLCEAYHCTVSTIRHVRQVVRSDGTLNS